MNELNSCGCKRITVIGKVQEDLEKDEGCPGRGHASREQRSVVTRTSVHGPVLSHHHMLCLQPLPGRLHFLETILVQSGNGCQVSFLAAHQWKPPAEATKVNQVDSKQDIGDLNWHQVKCDRSGINGHIQNIIGEGKDNGRVKMPQVILKKALNRGWKGIVHFNIPFHWLHSTAISTCSQSIIVGLPVGLCKVQA